MKTLKYIVLFSIACVLGLAACHDAAEEITSIEYARTFTPSKFTVSAQQTTAQLSWNKVDNVKEYMIQLSQDDAFLDIIQEVVTSSLSYTLQGLGGEQHYYVRLQSMTTDPQNQDDSKWSVLSFSTQPEQIFLPTVTGDVRATYATVKWTPGAEVTHLIVSSTGGSQQIELTASEKTAGAKKITDLTSSTNYSVSIYNGSFRRGRLSFTTLYKPSGPNVVTLTLGESLRTVMEEAGNVGKSILLPIGYTYSATGAILPKGTISVYGDPDGDQPIITAEAGTFLTLPATADSVVFSYLNIAVATTSNTNYFINQSAAATVGRLVINGCTIANFGNNMLRFQGANGQNLTNFIVNNTVVTNCGNGTAAAPTTGTYAFVNSNVATGKVDNITITNSTFNNISHTFLNVVGASSTPVTKTITIENCTFYSIVGVGGTRYFIDGNTYSAIKISLKNLIMGSTKGPDTGGIRNGAGGEQTVSNVYPTSDWVTDLVTGVAIPFDKTYTGSTTTLWVNPAAGDYHFKDAAFSGKATAGDPRWR